MLTIQAGRHTGTIKVWPDNQAARTGRWEARIRPYERSRSGARYQFTWELVPAHGDDRCGANAIVLARYKPGDKRVTGSVRTLPRTLVHLLAGPRPAQPGLAHLRRRDHQAPHLVVRGHPGGAHRDPSRRPVRRPYRPAAGDDRRSTARAMRPSWMQADWVRYYTLQRHNARSIKAPKMHKAAYLHGC